MVNETGVVSNLRGLLSICPFHNPSTDNTVRANIRSSLFYKCDLLSLSLEPPAPCTLGLVWNRYTKPLVDRWKN